MTHSRRRWGTLKDLTRERLIQFGKEGAGPVAISMDIGYIKLVVSHAAAVHGVRVQVEPIDLALKALKRLGLVSRARVWDRRPTLDKLRSATDHRAARRNLERSQ